MPIVLAALQAADLFVTRVSPRYGDAHLDHLGVPTWLRPVLPGIKSLAIVGLVVSVNRRRLRPVVGAGLVGYYAAATTFHVLSHDTAIETLPAATCGLLAASFV